MTEFKVGVNGETNFDFLEGRQTIKNVVGGIHLLGGLEIDFLKSSNQNLCFDKRCLCSILDLVKISS